MLWRAGWLGGLVLALSFLTLDTALAQPRRTALVIGNAAYESGPLRNPVNDATDVAAALQRLGFDVSLLRDAKMRAMEEAIETFSQKLRKGGVGLFYFAGHGLQVAGENYIVPIGARIGREQDVRFETVQVGRVLGGMEDAGNDVNLIILDACRDNPFARSFRSGAQRGLAVSSAVRGSLMAYATAPGKTAADGDGRNGVYTQQLLKYITTPGMKVEDVFKRVRLSVEDATNGQQTPWETTSLRGDFYFTGPDGAAASAAMATPSLPSSSSKPRPSSGDASGQHQAGVRPLSAPTGSQPQLGPQVAVGIYPPTVQTPAPTPSLQTRRNSLGMELVLIHPGEFKMGSDADRRTRSLAIMSLLARPSIWASMKSRRRSGRRSWAPIPAISKATPIGPLNGCRGRWRRNSSVSSTRKRAILYTGYQPKRSGNTRRGPGQRPNTILGTMMHTWSSMPGLTRMTRAPRIPWGN